MRLPVLLLFAAVFSMSGPAFADDLQFSMDVNEGKIGLHTRANSYVVEGTTLRTADTPDVDLLQIHASGPEDFSGATLKFKSSTMNREAGDAVANAYKAFATIYGSNLGTPASPSLVTSAQLIGTTVHRNKSDCSDAAAGWKAFTKTNAAAYGRRVYQLNDIDTQALNKVEADMSIVASVVAHIAILTPYWDYDQEMQCHLADTWVKARWVASRQNSDNSWGAWAIEKKLRGSNGQWVVSDGDHVAVEWVESRQLDKTYKNYVIIAGDPGTIEAQVMVGDGTNPPASTSWTPGQFLNSDSMNSSSGLPEERDEEVEVGSQVKVVRITPGW